MVQILTVFKPDFHFITAPVSSNRHINISIVIVYQDKHCMLSMVFNPIVNPVFELTAILKANVLARCYPPGNLNISIYTLINGEINIKSICFIKVQPSDCHLLCYWCILHNLHGASHCGVILVRSQFIPAAHVLLTPEK